MFLSTDLQAVLNLNALISQNYLEQFDSLSRFAEALSDTLPGGANAKQADIQQFFLKK